MNDKIARVKLVIAELELVIARVTLAEAFGDVADPTSLAALLDKAKLDLAQAVRTIHGQSDGRGDN